MITFQAVIASMLFYGLIFWFWVVADSSTLKSVDLRTYFYDLYPKLDSNEYCLEQPAQVLFRYLIDATRSSENSVQKTKIERAPIWLYGENSLTSVEIVELFAITKQITNNTISPKDQIANFAFANRRLEDFLKTLDLSNIYYLRLEFIGRKVLLISLTLYCIGVFKSWKNLTLSQKQAKFETIICYLYCPEMGWYVLNFLEYVVTSQISFFTFSSVELAQSFRSFHFQNTSYLEKGRPIMSSELEPTGVFFCKSNLLRLAQLFLKLYNPLLWSELNVVQKKAFLKTILNLTLQAGSYIYLLSLIQPVQLNNKILFFSALSEAETKMINITYKQTLGN